MSIELYEHQIKAVGQMKNGCVLCGGVGTGKSRTALLYFYTQVCGGLVYQGDGDRWCFSVMTTPRDLYIITTAKKRDSAEWNDECAPFMISSNRKSNMGGIRLVIDSWNNIKKYCDVCGAFFIFDEQRVSGSGAWVKSFLKIARRNQWILLSATPGDTWSDYIPVFIANGFYRNKTEFSVKHIVYSRFAKYPKIDRYVNTGELIAHRNDVLVPMAYQRETVAHHKDVRVDYDKQLYLRIWRDRWDIDRNEPIQETGRLFYLMRKVVNEDASRLRNVRDIFSMHDRVIVFYNFSYELAELRELFAGEGCDIGEWNGEVHSELPTSRKWAYLVQYSAGCEGWNCITTNTIIFYSQTYSYRMQKQAEGRIDRLNTPYTDLYYYHLKSSAPIDLAIARALKNKKNFNESAFLNKR